MLFGRCKTVSQALSDGDLVCYASGPTFSSLAACHRYLQTDPSNFAFADRVITAQLSDGPIFRVLAGCAAFIPHYLGVRKGGYNAVLQAVPAAGISDGLLEVHVKTRTRGLLFLTILS